MSSGARQVAGICPSRSEVVSGGASSASDLRAPVSAAAPARPAAAIEKPVLRKSRRSCMFAPPSLRVGEFVATGTRADLHAP